MILFDEIEKAHPDIANILLQILEDGILTDAYGNLVDFKNTLIIMTSNIGTKHLVNRSRMGFGASKDMLNTKELEDMVLKELRKDFSPEFINRIDETIVFHPLGRVELAKICRLLIDDVNATIATKGAQIDVGRRGDRMAAGAERRRPEHGRAAAAAFDPEVRRRSGVGALDRRARREDRVDRGAGRARRSHRLDP